MKKIVLLLAEGFEEIEAVTTIDILRRGGISVTIAALEIRDVTGAHGITIYSDSVIDDINTDDFDGIVLPGGQPGTNNLNADKRVISLIQDFAKRQKLTAAICAAPLVLASAGILDGKNATCYPEVESRLKSAIFSTDAIVVDGTIITSRGPATAPMFAFAILDYFEMNAQSIQLKNSMLFNL